MQSLKVHKIIEYIKQRGEFPFDTDEVIEELDKVLCFFNIYDELAKDEKGLLKDDLVKLAIAEQNREMALLAGQREADIDLRRNKKQSKLLSYL